MGGVVFPHLKQLNECQVCKTHARPKNTPIGNIKMCTWQPMMDAGMMLLSCRVWGSLSACNNVEQEPTQSENSM